MSKKTGFFLTFFLQFWWFLKFVSFRGNLSAKGKQFHLWKKMWFFDTPGTPGGASIVERIFLSRNSHCDICKLKILWLIMTIFWMTHQMTEKVVGKSKVVFFTYQLLYLQNLDIFSRLLLGLKIVAAVIKTWISPAIRSAGITKILKVIQLGFISWFKSVSEFFFP